MRNAVLAVVIAIAVHSALALAFVAYQKFAPAPDALASLDLSSVELSLADKDDEVAPVAPQMPTTPPPPPVRPKAVEPPPPPDAALATLPPDPAAMKFAEPDERSPEMVTPEAETETRQAREEKPAAAAEPVAAVAPRQARVDAPPRPKRAIRPHYPKGSRQRGEQGDVTVELRVGTDGHVLEVKIVKSSGFPELDAAAEQAAKAARFEPARSGNTPVESAARLTLTFRLK